LFKGWTPLHLSAQEGNTEVTKVLVAAGASLFAVDNEVIKHSVKLIDNIPHVSLEEFNI
jgi:ankyrin repeat protein